MSAHDPVPGAGAAEPKLRVFLSYSRKDKAFVATLADELTRRGYLADFDQSTHHAETGDTGIAPTDDWWVRLEGMIAAADVMVLSVSPDSAASKVVDEEIAYARSLSKRVIAITCRELDFNSAPPRLSALNVSHWFIQQDFETAFGQLVNALDRDVDWLRAASGYTIDAKKWEDAKRDTDNLLVGDRLAAAEAWSARRPAKAPEISELVLGFLAASREAQIEREAKERAAVRRTRTLQRWIGVAVTLAFFITMAGGWFVIDGQRTLSRQKSQYLATQSLAAFEDRKFDSAFRLAILAARSSWLEPASITSEIELGRNAFSAHAEETLNLHADNLVRVIFFPDDQSLLSFGRDGARVWTKTSKNPRSSIQLSGTDGYLFEAAISADGNRIVGAKGSNALVWSRTPDGRWSAPVLLEGHTDNISSVQFSADGSQILTTSDHAASVWRLDQHGKWAAALLDANKDWVRWATLSPDGELVLVGIADAKIRSWGLDRNNQWRALGEIQGSAKAPFKAAYSPDGKRLLIPSEDGGVVVLRQDSDGDWNNEVVLKLAQGVLSATFSADGASVVTISNDNSARVFSVDLNGKWSIAELDDGKARIRNADFSPDGRRILTFSDDSIARTWSRRPSGRWVLDQGHERDAESTVLSPAGDRFVTTHDDGAIRIWPVSDTFQPMNMSEGDPQSRIADYAPDGKSIVTAEENNVHVWTQNNKGRWISVPLSGHTHKIQSVAFSPDGRRIVTASYDKTARLWAKDAQGRWTSQPLIHDDLVFSAAFSPDGKKIVTASEDKIVRIWTQGSDRAWKAVQLKGHLERVLSARFSPDGKRIVSASGDGTAKVWMQSAAGLWTSTSLEGHRGIVWSGAFSPDGKRIVTASNDSSIRVWSESKDKVWTSVSLSLPGPEIRSALFSPDGLHIVTASEDKTARVWSQGEYGQWTSVPLTGHGGRVNSAVFSRDGSKVLTSDDGTTAFWDVALLIGNSSRQFAKQRNPALKLKPLFATVCDQQVVETEMPTFEDVYDGKEVRRVDLTDGNGKPIMAGVRRISATDTQSVPMLRGREGEDVCAWSPPWYDALLRNALGWAFR